MRLFGLAIVPGVVREGLGSKAAISCLVEELRTFFIPAYHEIDEIVLVETFHGSMDETLFSRH